MKKLPLEFQAKDKKMHIQISTQLELAIQKQCKSMGANKGAFVRAAMMNSLEEDMKPLKPSRFENFKVDKSFVFRVSTQLHEEISKFASKRNLPIQQVVREAIERAL